LQTVTDGLALGKSETVHWTNDKFEESGVLTYPPEYVAGRRYAMVLYIHGGPKSASVDSFAPSAQILAAQGWLVFEPNYRGSNSDGNAYEAAIHCDAGVGPGRDVIAGVKMLEARGIVDEKRIAVSGWSYGGYMTSWLIGNYPEVWAAAVAGAPVTDLTDQYALSDVFWLAHDVFGPSPFKGDGLKLYVAESPITYAAKMRTPTLILSDVGDYRVPTTQAYKLYHALKDNGVAVKFIAYPVTGHSPTDPIRARDVWRRWVEWLGPYLNAAK
jgi:dipeptidyl aminopeptidase/acylaminoacyl peptidase